MVPLAVPYLEKKKMLEKGYVYFVRDGCGMRVSQKRESNYNEIYPPGMRACKGVRSYRLHNPRSSFQRGLQSWSSHGPTQACSLSGTSSCVQRQPRHVGNSLAHAYENHTMWKEWDLSHILKLYNHRVLTITLGVMHGPIIIRPTCLIVVKLYGLFIGLYFLFVISKTFNLQNLSVID